MLVHSFEAMVILAATLIALGVKGFALVNAVTFSTQAYAAAGKLTKQGWLVILGVGFAAELVLLLLVGPQPLNLINLVFSIAALVYVLDVRPALGEVAGP